MNGQSESRQTKCSLTEPTRSTFGGRTRRHRLLRPEGSRRENVPQLARSRTVHSWNTPHGPAVRAAATRRSGTDFRESPARNSGTGGSVVTVKTIGPAVSITSPSASSTDFHKRVSLLNSEFPKTPSRCRWPKACAVSPRLWPATGCLERRSRISRCLL